MADLSLAQPAAAPMQRRPPVLPVLASGLATSVIALMGLWYLTASTDDFNVMGWYLWYVIPAGALIIGALSASGYGLSSWFTGVKISRGLMWGVLGLQVIAYFAAQYLSFDSAVSELKAQGYVVEMGFWQWFDETARMFAWKNKSGGVGNPLGGWGYFFKVLEIAGFAFGGMVVPFLLSSKSYCDACQRYRRNLKQLTLPMGMMAAEELPFGDPEAPHEAVHHLDQLATNAAAAELSVYRDHVSELERTGKSVGKSNTHLHVAAHVCPGCFVGYLAPFVTRTQGEETQNVALDVTWFPAEFGRGLVRR